MAEGEPAPFAGQLLSTELALELGLKAERCEALGKLELGYQERRCALEKKALRAGMQAAERPLPQQTWFVATVTSVGWLVVIFGVGYLVNAVSK